MALRAALRAAAYRSGALALHHRQRHLHSLTAAMFHRVLPAAVFDRSQADPDYTLTTDFFAAIVAFLRRHYNLVSLGDIMAARERRARLPPRALLLTFDDGWRDTLDHALPILRQLDALAVLFAASRAVEEEGFAGGRMCWGGRCGRDGRASRRCGARRARATTGACPKGRSARSIFCCAMARLRPGGARRSWRPLAGVLHVMQPATALSFPHGRYDAAALAAARDQGYGLIFTSDLAINPCPDGWLGSDMIGRIAVATADVAGPSGRLSPARLAAWMFLRPCVPLAGAPAERR